MADATDFELLQKYARTGCEDAFKSLVERHLNLVYSVALSQLADEAAAKDITQVVFAVLAGKAGRLSEKVVLSGWLFQVATHACQDHRRSEMRRKKWENEAVQNQITDSNLTTSFENSEAAPLINSVIATLATAERDAILLRFFEGREFRQVGARLGISEAAAKMRVARALEKLRQRLQKQGVTVSSAALCGAFPLMIHPAPAGVGAAVKAGAAVHSVLSPANTALLKGVLKTMAWTKAKMALVVGAAVLLAAGTTTTLVVRHQHGAKTPANFPRASWRNAGFGDPAATLQTLAWAVTQNDAQAVFTCLTPDYQAEFRKDLASKKPGTPAEEFLVQTWKQQLNGRSGIHIVQSQSLSTNAVLLDLTLQGGEQVGDHWIRLQKIGDEWKVDDFDPKGKNGRTGLASPEYGGYGGIGLELGFDKQSHAVRIVKVLPDSPAAQAGLVPGLILQKIDGTPTAGKTLPECVFLGRGVVGTKVWLELVDPEQKQTNTVELKRQKFAP